MTAPDYASLYNDYWQRSDRWGSSSFADVEALTDQVLSTCGGGRTLDVGCGMGVLVRSLLARGVDAVGLDIAERVVEEGNRGAPGRFVRGSVLDLPFKDGEFETVITTDVLEHLAPDDVGRAVSELARVSRRNVLVVVSTAEDRDRKWHLTVHGRDWWERACFAVGLRKHARTPLMLPFATLEREGAQITIPLEKIPAESAAKWPVEALAAGRDLHMDMLRETGRRSDAHLARYRLACRYIRPGDRVLDVACGMGYGAAVMAECGGGGAARVIGVDEDAGAVEYASANFPSPVLEFARGDASDLSFLGAQSVDVVVCLETLEHLADPLAALEEFERVLTPGGRLIVSVPNDWRDESGRDPNPHHLRVYTWPWLARQVGERFLLESAHAQTAGGALKNPNGSRRLVEVGLTGVGPDAEPTDAEDPEWWIAVAMKSPLGAGREGYRETAFGDHSGEAGFEVARFDRDYDNPWLVRSMVSIGMRATTPTLLEHLARGALDLARQGSADEGAALCVLAYRALEKPGASDTEHLLARLDLYRERADGSAHGLRWRISNEYVRGRLLLARGRGAEALEAFERCAGEDPVPFSPLLATKTVDALFRAGMLHFGAGRAGEAASRWRRALTETQRVLSGPWVNILGSVEHPLAFAMPEVAMVADLASRCAFALDVLERRPDNPALVWQAAHHQTFGDLRSWVEQLAAGKDWLEQQVAAYRDRQRQLEDEIGRLRAWIKDRDEGVAWLKERGDSLESGLRARDQAIGALTSAQRWSQGQAENWKAHAERTEGVVVQLREWAKQLQDGNRWLEGQVAGWKKAVEERDKRLAEMEEGRRWLHGQTEAWKAHAQRAEAVAAELREWTKQLREGNAWLEAQVAGWKKAVEERDRRLQGLVGAHGRIVEAKDGNGGPPPPEREVGGTRPSAARPAVGGGTG